MAVKSMGYDARSLLGFQVPIHTDRLYGKARIYEVDTARIKQELEENRIVTVAGFQGLDEFGNITTLGRGGSDTTAVALAASVRDDRVPVAVRFRLVLGARSSRSVRPPAFVSRAEAVRQSYSGCASRILRACDQTASASA